MPKIAALLAACLACLPWFAQAQAPYPAKPVTLIVPFSPGGPLDTVARPLANTMGKQLGRPMLIENVGGAGGNIGVARAVRAAPDGYTLVVHHLGMATSPALYKKLDYDPIADLEPIGMVGESGSMLLARSDFPAKDFKELIAYVKANKEKLSFANTGPGGATHLCSLLFMNAIQTEITAVPYKSGGLALNDLIAGRVDLTCDSVSTSAQHIRAGRVKAFGATSKNRSAALPDIPTLDEQGLAGFSITNWTAVYAPARTPRPVIDRLVAALQGSLKDSEFNAMLLKLDYKPATPEQASPAWIAQHLRAEIDKWGAIIRKAKISAD